MGVMILLSLLLASSAWAQPGAHLQAARLCGSAYEAVAARPARGVSQETRRAAVLRAGHELLGPGFNEAETAAILALMEDWLKRSGDARRDAGVEELLADAARQAHPQIGEGKGARGARNWARFVRAISRS
jgi:hypothetical protein